MIYKNAFKRILDISIACMALVVCGPVLLISLIGIFLSSPGPILFRQRRIGIDGKIFEILKLRTMIVNPERQLIQTTLADPEVFAIGRLLRRLKIDELPQVINVLIGDMSIVGPRPCLEQTFNEMPSWARRRAEVRPGITGQAQINGNIALSWEERWRHDVDYVENVSASKDIAIILKTVSVVLFGEEKFRRAR
jgi:undecaprenyl phosphate N,N'-diacetylbacillosamine 1-phosphate transferase